MQSTQVWTITGIFHYKSNKQVVFKLNVLFYFLCFCVFTGIMFFAIFYVFMCFLHFLHIYIFYVFAVLKTFFVFFVIFMFLYFFVFYFFLHFLLSIKYILNMTFRTSFISYHPRKHKSMYGLNISIELVNDNLACFIYHRSIL